MGERIHASYWLETPDNPARAAEVIAGEQSSGTFVALPNETPELKARSGARVERLEVLDGRARLRRARQKRCAVAWHLQVQRR